MKGLVFILGLAYCAFLWGPPLSLVLPMVIVGPLMGLWAIASGWFGAIYADKRGWL